MSININHGECFTPEAPTAQKRTSLSALQLGPRKKLTAQEPLVHHSRHFGRAVHAFCNVQTLISNGLSEEEIQKGTNDARADDTKGMKGTIINWITPKSQSLNPYIPHNVKSGRGFNYDRTRALLCPAGLDWDNTETHTKLVNGQIQVAGDQWLIMLYANYTYDSEDPWNGLLHSGLLVSAFKHIFTSPSSVDQEPKATRSGNAPIHGMRSVTKASVAYVATQVFLCTDLITDSEHFYNSVLELLEDHDEKDEVDHLMTWWNR
ncbi:hypothetical protein BU15DRAFT_89082 [Melanogaster broomeanus]|nr:hypothetical protein BU15DRAFT_89082 [Melanogaster broomeanus]